MTSSDREKLASINHVIDLDDFDYFHLAQVAIEAAENEHQAPRVKLPSFKQFTKRRLNESHQIPD